MENFIQLNHSAFSTTSTANILNRWLSYRPESDINTLAKLTRALAGYGYTSRPKRFGDSVMRVYMLDTRSEPGTVKITCSCGHVHDHKVLS